MIALIGFMGAGKTTVGHILAERLGAPFVDTDVLIEQRLGRPIRSVFEREGEAHFREIEHLTVAELVRGPEAVVALGGGAVQDTRSRAVLRNARVVYLQVGYQEALVRIQGDDYRPMLHRAGLTELYQHRLPIYQDLAAITVSTDGRRPDAVALDVLAELTRLPSTPAGTSSVLVSPVGGTYYAHIGRGLASSTAALLPPLPDCERVVVVESAQDAPTADTVAADLAATGLGVHRVVIPDTEKAKNLAAVQAVADELAEQAMHRDDVVVAVGGEVVCDVAGFVAATFNRGMKLVLVPTTLAAQADSAVGGKNGLNLTRGRNLIGTIHQPVAVVCDSDVACDNVGRGYRAGLAEIVKHALISRSDLRPFLHAHSAAAIAGDAEVVTQMTVRSLEIKADIVSRDERENGDRVHLNYGHTFAHAIEQVRDRPTDDQGEALALGLMAAAFLARRLGRITADVAADVVAEHRRLLADLGLPTHGTVSAAGMREAWMRDKKYRHGMRFVVLDGLGQPVGAVAADEHILDLVLADLAEVG